MMLNALIKNESGLGSPKFLLNLLVILQELMFKQKRCYLIKTC
jgi:hypothetical protein